MGAARTFVEACDAARIPILLVKGIVAATTLYEDPLDRDQSNDIDFRTAPEHLSGVRRLVRHHGWTIVETSSAYRSIVFRIASVEVDVETFVGPPHVSTLRVGQMLARAKPNDKLGFRALFPNFLDHAVLLVVNVFKDKLSLARPCAVQDLERVARHADFRPEAVAEALRDARVGTIGWIVADWLERERVCAPWGEVRERLQPFVNRTRAHILRNIVQQPTTLRSRLVARCGSDSMTQTLPAVSTMVWWGAERWLSRIGQSTD